MYIQDLFWPEIPTLMKLLEISGISASRGFKKPCTNTSNFSPMACGVFAKHFQLLCDFQDLNFFNSDFVARIIAFTITLRAKKVKH